MEKPRSRQGRPLPPGAVVCGRGRDEQQEHGCAGASWAGPAPLGPGVSRNEPDPGTLLYAWGKNRVMEGCRLEPRLVHSLLSPPQNLLSPAAAWRNGLVKHPVDAATGDAGQTCVICWRVCGTGVFPRSALVAGSPEPGSH